MKIKLIPLLITLSLVAFCFATVIYFTESPVFLFKKPVKSKKCAAIAIRDNVIPFQKFGTRLFTYPLLTGSYNEVIYLTEYAPGEKKQEFISGLKKLLQRYESVDIFLLAHANRYYEWAGELDPILTQHINMVYNTGCSGIYQSADWLKLGLSSSYIGHRSNESISPVFYFYFLRRWCTGQTPEEAVPEANLLMETKLKRLHALPDSTVMRESKAEFYGCSNFSIVE